MKKLNEAARNCFMGLTNDEYNFLRCKFNLITGRVSYFLQDNFFICQAALAVYREENNDK